MNQCGEMVYFANRICLLKEGAQSTPYTNDVGYLHRLCTLERAQFNGNDQFGGCAKISLAREGDIICVDASFYPKHNSEHYQPLKCINVAKMYAMRIKYAFKEKTHSTHPTQIM